MAGNSSQDEDVLNPRKNDDFLDGITDDQTEAEEMAENPELEPDAAEMAKAWGLDVPDLDEDPEELDIAKKLSQHDQH